MGLIGKFFRSHSVHFGSPSQNVLNLIWKITWLDPFRACLTRFGPKSEQAGDAVCQTYRLLLQNIQMENKNTKFRTLTEHKVRHRFDMCLYVQLISPFSQGSGERNYLEISCLPKGNICINIQGGHFLTAHLQTLIFPKVFNEICWILSMIFFRDPIF